jgi:hypothetical protein
MEIIQTTVLWVWYRIVWYPIVWYHTVLTPYTFDIIQFWHYIILYGARVLNKRGPYQIKCNWKWIDQSYQLWLQLLLCKLTTSCISICIYMYVCMYVFFFIFLFIACSITWSNTTCLFLHVQSLQSYRNIDTIYMLILICTVFTVLYKYWYNWLLHFR